MKYTDYLLEKLNEVKAELGSDDSIFNEYKIIVAPERIINNPDEENILLFVVKELSGTYTLGIKSTPVQIIGYSELNSFNILKQIMDLFTLKHQNESFYEGDTLFKQTYGTVVALRPLIDADIGFKASFYTYGQYIECAGLGDIKLIEYEYSGQGQTLSEEVKFISAALSYSAVLNTTKESGEEISTSETQEAGLTLTMTMMSDNSEFCKKIRQVMIGDVSNNTNFYLEVTISDDINVQLKMKLTTATISSNRTDAPGLELTFTM